VIEEFAKLTGVPVVLNTSFNLHEPIVETPEDAIACYLRTQIDVLVLGNFYSTRGERLKRGREVTELPVPAK
jgi:carbamoyltransferase